jgi:hypothetical protein
VLLEGDSSNDLDRLRHDPLLKLAGRLENAPSKAEAAR